VVAAATYDMNPEQSGGQTEPLLTVKYVEDHGLTPFDALHLLGSEGDTIVSGDEADGGFASPLDLRDDERQDVTTRRPTERNH